MDIIVMKMMMLGVMFILTIAAGLIPLEVLKALRHRAANAGSSRGHRHVSLVLCLLTCFSGGVFFATCFLHLFPELVENVKKLDLVYGIHVDYPVAELLSCLGFFLLFFLEEVVILLVPTIAHNHSHVSSAAAHHRPSSQTTDAETCCMTSVFAVPFPAEKNERNVDESTLLNPTIKGVDDEGETAPHCQTHCPLTAHARSSATKEECSGAVVTGYSRWSYGSIPLESSHLLSSKSNRNVCSAQLTFAEPERCETNCNEVNEDPPILMKSRPHAHSHGVRSITFVLALGIHSIIEGLAFGVMRNANETTALFVSLMVHKLIVAFSVVASMVTLAMLTPIGGFIGIAVSWSSPESNDAVLWRDITVTVLQGLAVGTFIYVTFFEVLLHERDNEHPNLLKLLLMFVGFSLIGALRLFDNHEHDGLHSHHEM